jgi:hypothetical protein
MNPPLSASISTRRRVLAGFAASARRRPLTRLHAQQATMEQKPSTSANAPHLNSLRNRIPPQPAAPL